MAKPRPKSRIGRGETPIITATKKCLRIPSKVESERRKMVRCLYLALTGCAGRQCLRDFLRDFLRQEIGAFVAEVDVVWFPHLVLHRLHVGVEVIDGDAVLSHNFGGHVEPKS